MTGCVEGCSWKSGFTVMLLQMSVGIFIYTDKNMLLYTYEKKEKKEKGSRHLQDKNSKLVRSILIYKIREKNKLTVSL